MPMPDDDEQGRTAFLRPQAPGSRAPDAEKPAGPLKGPPRLAIPIAQLPGKTAALALQDAARREHAAQEPTQSKVVVARGIEQALSTVPEQTRAQIEAAERGQIPDDISLDNQAPVQVDTNPEIAPLTSGAKVGSRETTTPETPGRYELKREFGRGGQSSVWLALDRHIGRDVAFKQLLPQASDPRPGASQVVSAMAIRFLREARITGQLEHPSIVPVYEVGKRPDGSLYYTQKLVRGRTFTAALQEQKTLRERLSMLEHFIDLCQAIAYAHKRGVIHRDIKPDNVMVGEFGETVVLDWGLAKQLGAPQALEDQEDLAKTQEGDIMGTPAYMSPEQAQGRKREVDAQSDIWSLGAVLYEILTGQAPFVGRNLMQMIIAVTKDPITPPQEIEPKVPPELAAIAMTALTRDRSKRYASALDLIRDVEAWRSGARVEVYRYTPWGTAARWLRKNRAVAITALCVLLALAVGSLRVGLENRVARRNLAQALLEKADASSRSLEWGKAAVYSAAAREEDDTAEARFRAAHRGPVEIEPLTRVQLPGPVDRLALSPDGQLLAVALTGMGVHLVDGKGQDLHALEVPPEQVGELTFSPDGALLVVASGSRILVFNSQSGEQVTAIEGPGQVEQVAFSADGGRMAAATGRSVRLYDVATWSQLAQLDGHQGQVRGVAFAPDQSGVASSGDDGTLRFWSPIPQRPGQHIDMKLVRGIGHAAVSRLAFAPIGRVLVPASTDGTVRFFDLDNGGQQTRIATNQGPLLDLAAAPQGLFAALGQDNTVVFVDTLSQSEVARLEGDDATTAVAISADAGRFASANRDGKLRLWRVTPGARIFGFEPTPGFGSALAVAFSTSGKQVAAGDIAGHIQLWEAANGKRTSAMNLPQGPVVALAWSPNGNLLAAAGPDDLVSLFDITTSQRSTLDGHQGPVRALAFSPDGKTLASVGQDGQIHLWDPAAQTQRATINASPSPLYAVTFSRDGKLLGAAGEDRLIHVYDAKTKKPTHKIEPSPDVILSIAFSPHNSIVAAAGRDQAVRTFHISNGRARAVWNGHGARIHSIAFAPDGELLASASADGSIRLWDVYTGRQVVRFERPPEPQALAFSPDGRLLVSVGERPSVQMVELDDKSALLKPAAELQRQQALHHLRFEGILLVDDLDGLQGKPWKLAPASPAGPGAGE